MGKVFSLYGLAPRRMGGIEALVRETTVQLAEKGWDHVAAFAEAPSAAVRDFLSHPNLTLEVVPEPWSLSLRTLATVRRLLRKHRPDVLHFLFTGYIGPYPWLAASCGVPRIVFTDQGSHPEDFVAAPAPAWKRWMARAINSRLNRVTYISEANLRSACETGYVLPDRTVRIYNGVIPPENIDVPVLAAKFRNRFGIPDGRQIVLKVSSLIAVKGVEDMLDAAALVLKQRRDVQFVFGGDGAQAEQFRAKAESLGIADHVTWTGLLQNPIWDGAFPAADIVCQVSRWTEAFGITITEAMSVCRPVIATAVGGIPEIVEEGVTGYLVPKRDPQAIADRVLKLLSNPDLRLRMGAAGRARVASRFDLRRIASEYLREYGVD